MTDVDGYLGLSGRIAPSAILYPRQKNGAVNRQKKAGEYFPGFL
jgi:hypothetical protein